MPGTETLVMAFQAALLAAMRSVAPTVPASQQAKNSETPRSGEFQQKSILTETGPSLATGAESDMDIGITVSDTGVDVVEGAAADTLALEPEPEPQRELQTPVLPTETPTTKISLQREKTAD